MEQVKLEFKFEKLHKFSDRSEIFYQLTIDGKDFFLKFEEDLETGELTPSFTKKAINCMVSKRIDFLKFHSELVGFWSWAKYSKEIN